MTHLEFLQIILILVEGLSFFVGILHYKKIKDTYWKYFVLYCGIIFFNELFSLTQLEYFPYMRKHFYNIYGVPIQFLFLYWLYAYKTLAQKQLYKISVLIYLASFLPHLFYNERYGLINSMSYTIGCLLLLIMCIIEFNKQIKSDNILNFKSNKMFYINIGVILFYIGTLPFYSFYMKIYQYDKNLYNNYRLYSLIACILLYLFYTASFIWGKPKK